MTGLELANPNPTITETLTSSRRACLKKLETLRQKKKVLSYWTANGKIFYTTPNEPEKKLLLKPLNVQDVFYTQ